MRHDDPIYRKINRSSFMLNEGLFSSITRRVISNSSSEDQSSNLSSLLPVLGGVGVATAATAALLTLRKQRDAVDEIAELAGDVISESEADSKEGGVSKPLEDVQKKMSDFVPKSVDKSEPSIFDKIKDMFTFTKPTPQPPPQVTAATGKLKDVPVSVLGSKLPGDYRSAYDFSGFPGADKVSKNGRYTQEEAYTLQKLKIGGTNTSATGKMSSEIEETIRGYARKYQVDEEQALRVARMESGGNPNAISSTGAIGVYQFTGRTASDYGITNRFDATQNIEAGIKFMASSSKRLRDAGLPDDPISQYLVHQLGFSGASELLKAAALDKKVSELSPSLQSAVRMNAGSKNASTVRQYIEATRAHMDARTVAVVGPKKSESAPQTSSVTTPQRTSSLQQTIPASSYGTQTTVVAEISPSDLQQKINQQSEPTTEPQRTPPNRAGGVSSSRSSNAPPVNGVVRLRNGIPVAV